jgi:D-alanine transaminase
VTRTTLLDAVEALGLTLKERGFTVEEALAAREAFVTSASQTVMPVVKIDGPPVGTGSPGPLTRALRRDFLRFAQST